MTAKSHALAAGVWTRPSLEVYHNGGGERSDAEKKDGLGFLESKKTFLRVFFSITCVYKPNQLALIHIVVG